MVGPRRRPCVGVELDGQGGACARIAGGQMPSLLHAPGMDADRRADLVAGGGEFSGDWAATARYRFSSQFERGYRSIPR